MLASRIAQGAGRERADLVIRDVRLLDVVTGAVTPTDIAVCGDIIVGTEDRYDGARVLDGRGRFAVPGFVDTHLHVESSLVTPAEFDRCVLPRGTTTAICDPHEIANVLGADGVAWMLEGASRTALDLFVQVPSCVPATAFETAGARLEAGDLRPFAAHPRVLGLAEFMNFPGVVAGDPAAIAKLEMFAHRDGHAPLLRGRALNAYLAAGIRTEHEATTREEAEEKLRKGMSVLIREGSVSKDLHALAPLITADTASFLGFCTDDRNPLDIAEEGHLDALVRGAIALGVRPHHAYRVASWGGANAFGLRDRGRLAPGWRADIVLVESLEGCEVTAVVSAGRVVEDALFRPGPAPIGLHSLRLREVSAADFAIAPAESFPVIAVTPGRIITGRQDLAIPGAAADPARDIAKVAVLERHGRNGNIGRGFVTGFGMRRGAIASSVGHDSHNVTVVGVDDADMAAAANRLRALGGGFVVAAGGAVRAEIALPVAGLMSQEPFEAVCDHLRTLREAARALGCTLPEPFLQVAFLPLPVIPHLKITDRGMFDVDAFRLL